MQTEYRDGSLGEAVSADTVEELLPKIKAALGDPKVKCVRVFNNGCQVGAEEERKSGAEQATDLMRSLGEGDAETVKKKKQAVAGTIPRRK